MRISDRSGRALIRSGANWAKQLPWVREALSDSDNLREFTDLYEHEKMLADSIRVETYRRGIERYIHKGDVVVDLGTGSGILSVLAAKRGAIVYAIDHSPFIDVARQVAAQNLDASAQIHFIKVNSREFSVPDGVDVILHEQIGDELFDENMVENVLDLKQRLLRPGGRIIPSRFELYLEPVSISDPFNVPFIWESKAAGLDFSALRGYPHLDNYKRRAYSRRWVGPETVECIPVDPAPIVEFDLQSLESADELPTTVRARRIMQKDARIDGLMLYFACAFDDAIRFDSNPLIDKVPSWGNPLFRSESVDLLAGAAVTYEVEFGVLTDISTWTVTGPSIDTSET